MINGSTYIMLNGLNDERDESQAMSRRTARQRLLVPRMKREREVRAQNALEVFMSLVPPLFS